jgi:hypothetical protein
VGLYNNFDPIVQLQAHLEVNDASTEANLVCQALNQLVQQDKCFFSFLTATFKEYLKRIRLNGISIQPGSFSQGFFVNKV